MLDGVRDMNQIGCGVLMGAVGAIATMAQPIAVQAIEDEPLARTNPPAPQLSELDAAATTVEEWLAQEASLAQSLTQVIGIQVNGTETGLEIVLETAEGQLTDPVTSVVGNALIADFSNAVLALPDADEFSQATPVEGIAFVTVTSRANGVRVAITGSDAPPTAIVRAESAGLVLSVTPGTEAADTDDEAIQVVVTGEQEEGYNPSSATTATRTDTPLRDIPASISVIPRQVLQDQNTLRLQDALQNVSGVNRQGNFGGTDAGGYIIRGFAQEGNFRNGLPDNDFYSSVDTANIERIEVLRGPASVLFGQVEPGGIVNVVTEQPLAIPYYSVGFSAGSEEFYRPSLDFSGPLTDDGSVLYRLNVAYQNSDSFRDFNFTERVFVAPVITWDISDRTALTVDAEYLNNNYFFDRGLPSLGDSPAPIPIDRLVGLPDSIYDDNTFRIGYRLQHQFNQNWQLRNAFSFVTGRLEGTYAIGGRELVDEQFSEISVGRDDFQRETYTLQTEVEGRFNTGSIVHRPLIGVELRRNIWDYTSFDVADPILLDIFDPDYEVSLPDIPDEETFSYTTRRDTVGIYLQDQITLAENLKLLLGGRFDGFYRRDDFGTPEEESLTDFSPRVGIVYQPTQTISLYASYSESFQPDRFFGRSATGDPFEPTRGTQYEVGLKADISERLSATLAAFHLTRTNVVTPDANDPRLSVQVGEQRSQGIELDLNGEILPGWNIIASYAYTDAITSEDNVIPIGNRINGVPENAASLWTTYEIQRGDLSGLGFGLGFYYVGDRFADNENTSILEDYFRVDSALYYQRENWRVALNIRNLLDTTYYEASQARNIIYPGAPFTVIGSVSVQF
jgi:iron complex outermembrane recepter protein